jgi:hypothetical protein
MFKKVEYVGFDAGSELEAKARRANDVLGAVVTGWRDEIAVGWRPAPLGSKLALELSLTLALWNAAGSVTGGVRARGFEPGEEHALRIDLREVWLDLLGDLSRQQTKRLAEMSLEPAEA